MKAINPNRSLLDHSPIDIHSDVKKFFDLAQPELLQKPGQKFDQKVVRLALFLIDQEVNKELIPDLERLASGVCSREVTARVLDNIVDSIYVLTWTAIAFNLPLNAAWKEVQLANMAKFPRHPDCGGKGCEYVIKDLKVVYDGAEIEVTAQCVGGLVVARNKINGKVIKPMGWPEPDVFGILQQDWKEKIELQIDKDEKDPNTQRKGFQQEDWKGEKLSLDQQLAKKKEDKK